MQRKFYLVITVPFLALALLSVLSVHTHEASISRYDRVDCNFDARSISTFFKTDTDIYSNDCMETGYVSRRDWSSRSNGIGGICWVDSYDSSENASWTFTGDSPYLNNDTASKVVSVTVGNCSWFHFQDTNLTQSQTVYLMIEWKTRFIKSGEEAKVFLDNGMNEEDLGSYNLTLEFRWTRINVTHTLETISKIDAAKLKISSLHAGIYLVSVRRAYLKIYNGPIPLQVNTVASGRPGSQVTLEIQWIDPDGLSSYALSHNASGVWLVSNLTAPLDGKIGWSNHTLTLPNDTASVLAYRFWANDTYNFWEGTEVLYVCVLKNFSPELLQIVDNTTGSPIAHSYGRKDFYDNVTGRFWKFYSDGAYMRYTSSTDGQDWILPNAIRSAEFGFQFYFHCFNQTVYYVYNSEAAGADLHYRKGTLNVDGTISWNSPEQVVVSAGTSQRFYACSVIADKDGYPYIVFGNRTNHNLKTLNLVKSDYNNGTWKTTSGFPMMINENPDSDLVSGVALTLPNNEIYVVYCSAGNEEPPRGRLWNTSVLGPIEDASALTMSSNYPFCAVSDMYGHIHLVYRRTTDRVDYSFRNYTTRSWEIKDEFVTSHLTHETLDATTYSWPVIGWNIDSEKVYVHWWTLEDKCGWLKLRNSTDWETRHRILKLDYDYTIIDGDTVAPLSHQNRILMNFVVQNVEDGQEEVRSYLYLNRKPQPDFSVSEEIVYTGESIVFNASESYDPDGLIVEYFWDFADEINASGLVVDHSYADNGNYTVTLTVMDDSGAINYTSAIITVLNRPPVASFTESAETAFTGEIIILNASHSFDLDGTVVGYFWDFGDGTNATGVLAEHSYLDNDYYNVSLTVTDDDDAKGNITSTKTILNRAPIALFTESAEVVSIDEIIYFNASESYDLDGYVIDYFWDFGDGVNSTGITVEHSYAGNGTYTVTLFVTDDDDAKGNITAAKTILHHDVAVTALSPSKTVVGEGFSLNVNVTIMNQGDFSETFNVTIYANTTSIATQNATLTAGNSTNLIFTWNTSSSVKGNYTLTAYVTPVSEEKEVDNNLLEDGWIFLTIPGDVDADRDVDIFDIVAIVTAYGSAEGDPEYVPNYDINDDGKVDIFDIVIASGNYKKTW